MGNLQGKLPIALGIGAIVAAILVSAYFVFFRSGTKAPEAGAPSDIGDGINDVVDNQIEEIANDVANAAREGYIYRREYMSPDPSKNIEDFTKIVLSNIVGKPIKAVISRDDVSGILKVLMTGVDPNVFEPSVSAISDCVSDKLKTSKQKSRPDIATYTYDCADDYFSTNKSEFNDKIVPAALTMYENAYNEYAPEKEREKVESQGGIKKTAKCLFNYRGPNIDKCLNDEIDNPQITWDKVREILDMVINPPTPTAESDFKQ